MKRDEMLAQQNYRLKNQITDLRNALSMNKDFLGLLARQEHDADSKNTLLYKIVLRLTEQSNQALLNNLELIQQKQVLKDQIFKLNEQLDLVEERLSQQIQKNNKLEQPTEAKVILHQQMCTLNNELLASQEQKILLQDQVRHWKGQFNTLQNHITERIKTSPQTQTSYSPSKPLKINRKYLSNTTAAQNQRVKHLERQIKHLKQYIEELENRLHLFVKAHAIQEPGEVERTRQRAKSSYLVDKKLQNEIGLLKYAANQIKIFQKGQDVYMSLKRTFRDKQGQQTRSRKKVRSHPKQSELDKEKYQDQDFFEQLGSRFSKKPL